MDELSEFAEGFVVAHFLVPGKVERVEEGVEVSPWWLRGGSEAESVDAEGFVAGFVVDREESWGRCGAGE